MEKDATLYCNFCGRENHEVKQLIAGPTVFICDECVWLCAEIALTEGHVPANKGLARIVELEQALRPFASEPIEGDADFHRTRLFDRENYTAIRRRARALLGMPLAFLDPMDPMDELARVNEELGLNT